MSKENSNVINELTQENFETFKTFVKGFIEKWGLFDWHTVVVFEEIKDGYGSCVADTDSGLAVITLNPIWDDYPPTRENLKRVAFHEVAELLVWELNEVSQLRYTTQSAINAARHRLIRRLENSLLP